VLEETVEKLSFLGSITPDVLAHRDELSKFVGDEISRIITEQSGLEARYEDLITERGNLKGLANKSRYKEVQEEIAEVSRALRESTKQLCRNLKDNPNISGNLIKIQRERSELIEVSFFFIMFSSYPPTCYSYTIHFVFSIYYLDNDPHVLNLYIYMYRSDSSNMYERIENQFYLQQFGRSSRPQPPTNGEDGNGGGKGKNHGCCSD